MLKIFRDVISRCCSSFLMAAGVAAYSLHHGQRCIAGGFGGISCGNGRHTVGISINCIINSKKDP